MRSSGRIPPTSERIEIKPSPGSARATTGMIISQVGAGRTVEQILADYPDLKRGDVLAAFRYATWLAPPE